MSKLYEYCPSCKSDVDYITYEGICEKCEFDKTATAKEKEDRRRSDLIDLLERGYDVDLT